MTCFASSRSHKKQIKEKIDKNKQSMSRKRQIAPRLVTSLNYVLLLVLIIILCSRLSANELPNPTNCAANQDPYAYHACNNSRSELSLEDTKTFKGTEAPSINRHYGDHGNFPPMGHESPNNGSPETDNISAVKAQERSGSSSNSSISDLLVAPSGNLAQVRYAPYELQKQESLPNQAERTNNGNSIYPARDFATTLSELTAAGTMAGLMVNDLLSRNAPQNVHPEVPQTESSNQGADFTAAMSMNGQMSDIPLDSNGIDEGDEEGVVLPDQNSLPSADNQQPIYNSYLHQKIPEQYGDVSSLGDDDLVGLGKRGDHRSSSRALSHAQSAPSKAAEIEPAPLNEDQVPDSMDSLVRSEGDNVDFGDRDEQEKVSDSNLVNSKGNLLQQGANQLAPGEAETTIDPNDSNRGNDNDDDEDDRDVTSSAGNIDARADVQDESESRSMPQSHVASFEEDLSNSIVTPMRDSLTDLSTAAGHHYGKKKKKVKIILKKKKKKKYVKKKVKIVKKKKKPKKKYSYKKKHHDHGKYYM